MGAVSAGEDEKSSGEGWGWRLHDNVNVLSANELYLNMVKMVNFMCILSQFWKIKKKETKMRAKYANSAYHHAACPYTVYNSAKAKNISIANIREMM